MTRTARYVVATVMTLAVVMGIGGCTSTGATPSESPSYQGVQVTRGDLSTTHKWTGVLTYDNPFDVVYQTDTASTSSTGGTQLSGSSATSSSVTSIITWIATPGSVLNSGDVLYRVNNVPVAFLEGDAVLWRSLKSGSEGDDVLAVETALTNLGYNSSGGVTVDQNYRTSTSTMVKRFQEAYGLTESRTFDFRSVAMRPGEVVVTDASLAVGDSVASGDTVLTISDTTRAVVFPISPEERPDLKVGDEVKVTLPSGDVVTGTVSLIAAAIDTSTETYDVTAIVPGVVAVTGDKISVSVSLVVPLVQDALIVPPKAIIVRDDGSMSVKVVRNGELVSVDVTVLATSGQSTAISSPDLAEGDTIVVN